MDKIAWDSSLSVEVDEVDDDHKRLVELFNLLAEAVQNEEPNDYIEALLVELVSCAIWHFKHEERLMLRYKYPHYQEHLNEHDELIKNARELQAKFIRADRWLTPGDIEYLANWLTGHILNQDMKMGFFLMKAM